MSDSAESDSASVCGSDSARGAPIVGTSPVPLSLALACDADILTVYKEQMNLRLSPSWKPKVVTPRAFRGVHSKNTLKTWLACKFDYTVTGVPYTI